MQIAESKRDRQTETGIFGQTMEAIVIDEQTLMRAPPSVSYTTQSK